MASEPLMPYPVTSRPALDSVLRSARLHLSNTRIYFTRHRDWASVLFR